MVENGSKLLQADKLMLQQHSTFRMTNKKTSCLDWQKLGEKINNNEEKMLNMAQRDSAAGRGTQTKLKWMDATTMSRGCQNCNTHKSGAI